MNLCVVDLSSHCDDLTRDVASHSLLTQTRPANMYADSPTDSPGGFTQFAALKRTMSDPNDESQVVMTQTQVDDEGIGGIAQTPTQQRSRGLSRLRRGGAMASFSDASMMLPATEIVEEEDEGQDEEMPELDAVVADRRTVDDYEDRTQNESLPTAAQPTNAFSVMLSAAAAAAAKSAQGTDGPVTDAAGPGLARKQRSAFIEREAVLSDDEEGGAFGGLSGDEDEGGLDAELESLVDNEEVDREVQAEQDEAVGDLYA